MKEGRIGERGVRMKEGRMGERGVTKGGMKEERIGERGCDKGRNVGSENRGECVEGRMGREV